MTTQEGAETEPEAAQHPVNNIDENKLRAAQEAGHQWGEEYPSIWDSLEAVAPTLGPAATEAAEGLLPRAQWWNTYWYLAAWVALLAGCVFIGMGVNPQFGEVILNIGFLIVLISVGLWGASVAITSEKNKGLKDRRRVLKEAFADAALDAIETHRNEARTFDPAAARDGEGFTPGGPAPLPQPYGVSHEGAEQLVAEWMRYLGAVDVKTTQFTGDGGVDVTSHHYIAQAKNYTGSVDVESIRALGGVAYADGRKPLFFTSGAYSAGSIAFATQVGMALFTYNAVEGTIAPSNDIASRYMTTGL